MSAAGDAAFVPELAYVILGTFKNEAAFSTSVGVVCAVKCLLLQFLAPSAVLDCCSPLRCRFHVSGPISAARAAETRNDSCALVARPHPTCVNYAIAAVGAGYMLERYGEFLGRHDAVRLWIAGFDKKDVRAPGWFCCGASYPLLSRAAR